MRLKNSIENMVSFQIGCCKWITVCHTHNWKVHHQTNCYLLLKLSLSLSLSLGWFIGYHCYQTTDKSYPSFLILFGNGGKKINSHTVSSFRSKVYMCKIYIADFQKKPLVLYFVNICINAFIKNPFQDTSDLPHGKTNPLVNFYWSLWKIHILIKTVHMYTLHVVNIWKKNTSNQKNKKKLF